MKILYIATSFPKPKEGATIYTDLAEAIASAGHEIVIAVAQQYNNQSKNDKQKNIGMMQERGLPVIRIPVGNYYEVSLIQKGITTLLLPFKMRLGLKKYLKNQKIDLILFESPPITNASLIAWVKKKCGCSAFLMLKDIFPQNAVDLKIISSKGLLYKYFKRKEIDLYHVADKIGCMSPANRDYIIQHNPWMNKEKVELFPNTKKFTEITKPEIVTIRKRLNISDHACVFLFGGNMGKPQCIELLVHVIQALKMEKNIYFLFVGRGTERYKLKNIIRKQHICNARVIDNLPRDTFEQLIRESDVGLVVLDPRFTIPNYPSRILSYMEYAKPILAATDYVSDIKELIKEADCGKWIWSGDEDGFIQEILNMSKDAKCRREQGMNGRNYGSLHFSVENSVEIINQIYEKVKQ